MRREWPTHRNGAVIARPCTLTYDLGADPGDLNIELKDDSGVEFDELIDPCVFAPSESSTYLLYPNLMGPLLPVRFDHPLFNDFSWQADGNIYNTNGGTNMACLGLVNLERGQGLLTIYATPELAGFRITAPEDPAGHKIQAPGVKWYADKGGFGPARRLILHFSDQEWATFLQSNRLLVPLKPNHTYEVSFDTKVLEATPGKKMFCCVTSAVGGNGAFVGEAAWWPKAGDKGRQTYRFTTRNYSDYVIGWGL